MKDQANQLKDSEISAKTEQLRVADEQVRYQGLHGC